jgi:DNA polymerase-1
MPKTLYIIDGHAHIYAAYFAPMKQRLTSPSGEPTKATYIFTTTVLSLLNKQKPDMVIMAMDSRSSFRTALYPEYKAHRPPMPDDMAIQISRIEEIAAAMNIPPIRIEGYEADDVIGTVAKKAAAEGIEVFICSKDKDMLQLLDERINCFDISSGEKFDLAAMREKIKVEPAQFVDVLALQGDNVDNVPGIPDVGPKTALEWIQKYGSLENLYAHADEVGGKRGDRLRAHKAEAFKSRELVIIDCNVPLKMDYEAFAVKPFDNEKLSSLFNELGFSRLLDQLGLEKTAQPMIAAAAPKTEHVQLDTARTVPHEYQLIDTAEKFNTFCQELKRQNIFAIDTETTGLDAMRDGLVGISISWQAHKAFYLAFRGPMCTQCVDVKLARERLGPLFADENINKVGQNIKFDMHVLETAGMPLRGVVFDTMVASYVLDASRSSHSMDNLAKDFLNYEPIPITALIGKKGAKQLPFDLVDTETASEYAAEDADVTWRLYEYFRARFEKEPRLKKLFEEVEMPLVVVLQKMERNGVFLDTKLLKSMSGELDSDLVKITSQIYSLAGVSFNLDSPKQLGEVLFDRLGLASVRSGKVTRSTDSDVLEELSDAHPIIDLISQYRQLAKLKNTYLDKLGTLISPRTGRVHASFNQTITATGRLSSSDPNLQNIPIRTELGKKIRAAFVAQNPGDCILAADYSQIELRLLAHFSEDKALSDAFAADQDIHRFVASQIFGVPLEEVTTEMRSRCKAVNFGIIYGQSAFGLSRTIGIGQGEARKFIDDYYARYKSIRQFMDNAIASAKRVGYAQTILGRRRSIEDLGSRNFSKRSLAERLAVNTVIQGSAADLIKVAMINIQLRIDRESLPVKMILQVHDELVFELPKADSEKYAAWIRGEMINAIKLDVPLKVDITIGPSWLEK